MATEKTWCTVCQTVVIPDEGSCPECQAWLTMKPLTLDELIDKLLGLRGEFGGKPVSINGCDCAELAGDVEISRDTARHGDLVGILRIDD